ncbi:ATP-binding protein [Spirillospora sp. NPDC050679]
MSLPAGPGRGNLPCEPNELVGRRRELERVRESLAVSRLVTLTGVGGVGKSRVALRAAREALPRHTDGVWLVELGAVQDAAMLPHTVAAVLGLADQTVRPQTDVLAEYLADRRALLVLDGCEHLRSPVAELVKALLAAAPGLVVLATGRQALGLPGERRLTVRPLPVPEPPGDGDPPLEALRDNPAVRLFMARAAAAAPGFELTSGTGAVVARLCRRLDGIPLALELAAVRLNALSPEEVLARLEDRFALLGSAHAALPRHQTLRTAIGWSHELCTPGERLLWARLSVFAGTMGVEAVQAICTDDRLPPADLPELLTGLVDKSILLWQPQEAEGRFRLLDTLREYGAGWLGALGEERVLRRRHRDHYKDLALRCENEWYGPGQLAWYRRLLGDHANLRAALDHCLSEPGEARAGLAMAAALWPLWTAAGFTREGRHYLDRLVRLSPEPSPERTKALARRSWVETAQSDHDTALATAREAAAEAAARDDLYELACALAYGGLATALRGDPAGGAKTLGEALETFPVGPADDFMALHTMGMLGVALGAADEAARAVEVLAEARRHGAARGEQWLASHLGWIQALAELGRGDRAAADRHVRAALPVRRLFRDAPGLALCLEMLAAVAAAEERGRRVARLHGAADRIWRTFSVPQLGSPVFAAVHDRAARTARTLIGDCAYTAEAKVGGRLDQEETIAYALAEPLN